MKKVQRRYRSYLWLLPFVTLSPFPATEALPAPLLEEVVNGVYPAARGYFTLFDVLLFLLIVMMYFRWKKPSRRDAK